MCPRTQKQFAEIRREKRRIIVSAALTLFARKGFAETTMEEIARRAGISKGLIYNYFPSKLEILDHLITEVVRNRLPMLLQSPDRAGAGNHMEALIRAWAQLIRTEPELMRLFNQIHLSGHLAKIVLRRHGKLYTEMVERFFALFRRLNSPDPISDAYLLGALFDGISLNYAVAPEIYPIDKMERRLIEMFAHPKE